MIKSVLFIDKDATIENDKELISSLVYINVIGGKKDILRKECVEKILQVIHSTTWQKKYRSSHFVHLVDLYNRQEIGDIKFMMMCQLLEILYFFRCNKKPAKNLEKRFDNKLEILFYDVYKKSINKKTSNIIRILRNHVAHTGTLHKIRGVLNSKDVNAISGFNKRYKVNSFRVLAFSFNYLMEDIFLRSVGLDDSVLLANLRPPQYLDYFKM